MKSKSIIIKFIYLLIIFIIVFLCIQFAFSFKIRSNHDKFRENLLSISKSTEKLVELNDLTPFEWDEVYFFDAYTSKNQIFKIIGNTWLGIKEQYTEGSMQIIFLNKGNIVCYCNGTVEKNHYYINVDVIGKYRILKRNENPIFTYNTELSSTYIILDYYELFR